MNFYIFLRAFPVAFVLIKDTWIKEPWNFYIKNCRNKEIKTQVKRTT